MRMFEVGEITPSICGGELFNYVVWWIKNPDLGSAFDKKTRYIRWLPGRVLLWLMTTMQYSGFLFMQDSCDEIIGHIFYQRQEDALHIFSIATRREFRCHGVGTTMTREALLRVQADASVKRVRIGAGGHPAVDKIWCRLIEGRLDLPFKVESDLQVGWARFVR